jgi:hypothetical protein
LLSFAATAHLTFEETRDQYIGGIPGDIAERMEEACWQEDWQIMSRPQKLRSIKQNQTLVVYGWKLAKGRYKGRTLAPQP